MTRRLIAFSAFLIFAATAVSQDAPGDEIQVLPDTVPRLLVRKVAPTYPPLARAARVSGTVALSIVINKDGEVRDPKLVSGHPMLAPAAIEAIRQWRYGPDISEERPAEMETVVRVSFRLPDGRDFSTPPPTIPQLVRVSAGVMQGLLDNKVDPEYPAEAKQKHVEGTVVLNADIDAEGNVGRVELVSGHPQLAAAAMDAVLQWRYRPFVLNGEPVPVGTTVRTAFAGASEGGMGIVVAPTESPIVVTAENMWERLVYRVAPMYPPLARQARIQGTVVLRIVINTLGEVRDAQLVSGHPMLAPAAVEAVKKWRYIPCESDGKAVEIQTDVQVIFRMAGA